MKIKLEQLKTQLQQSLKPIYVITGDEPLLVEETSRYINKIAKQQGFSERKILQVSAKFNWDELAQETQSLSLFSEKKILELHIANGKPGKIGSASLIDYTNQPITDFLLIIRLPKLPKTSQKSKWFTTLEKNGVVINIWPISNEQLPNWIRRCLARVKLNTTAAGIAMLVDLSAGNLLAAKQNVEKLSLLYGEGEITATQIEVCLNDNAHYDIYALLNSVLALNPQESIKILNNLNAIGVEPILIIWVLSKEVRILAQLANAVAKGTALSQLWQQHGIWTQRQPLLKKHLQAMNYSRYLQILQQAAHCDRILKGVDNGEIWQSLQQLILNMCKVGSLVA